MYDILADMKRHQKDREYEMVNTNGAQGMEADSRLFQYGLPSLDRDWEPVLRDRLKPHDVTDGPVSENFDELDARGSIPAAELESALRDVGRFNLEHEFGISWNRVRDIVRQADVDRNGIIKYKEFLKTLSRYRLTTEQETKVKGFVRAFAYVEEFKCWPPPLFMILVTLLETAIFVYHVMHLPEHGQIVDWEGPVPYCSVFIYNPYRRWEAWRFLTYMLVHIGIGHFVFNMIMQIIVGLFIEMEQEGWVGSLRVAAVYLAGVVAGSLGTSLSDPYTYIAGASGGCYALIAAHLATLALNWHEDSAVRIRKVIHKPLTRIIRLVFIITLTLHDIGFAIYVRYFTDGGNQTGFMGHLCGALAGLLVGLFILDNRRVDSWEPVVQWISFALYCAFIIFAVVWNIFANQWVPGFYPRPDFRLYDDDSGNCKHYEYV